MIKLITEIESTYPLMKQLRQHISLEQFLNIYNQAHKSDGYNIYGYIDTEKTSQQTDHVRVVGLMGVRILYDYVHGRHLYIDDLVVDETCRSQGVGKKLLDYAEDLAKKFDCTGLRLCTGVENKDGMRFYERENWKQRAVVFKKKL